MGGHWWSKQELKIFKFGKGTQVKGAVIVVLFCISIMYNEMYETGSMFVIFCQFSCFVEIFQKPPGGHWKSPGGSSYFYDVCGFQRWDRLEALPDPPGDSWRLTSFLGFCLNCLAVMINHWRYMVVYMYITMRYVDFISSSYLLVFGDDRVRGTREQRMLMQVVLVILRRGARDNMGFITMFYWF